MPDVLYIAPGQELDAATWNGLFAEADFKITQILSGYSLLHLTPQIGPINNNGVQQQVNGSLTGKCFFFGRNSLTDLLFGPDKSSAPSDEQWGASFSDYYIYNHAPFLDFAANGALTGVYNIAQRTLNLQQAPSHYYADIGFPAGVSQVNDTDGQDSLKSLFTYSLQAHTRPFQPPIANPPPLADYNLWETASGALVPEVVYAYNAVELVFTASGNLPPLYDKYNFFRIHNFNANPITVTIETWSATIPGLGSVCVRRTGVGGTYYQGWNHLWPMIPGDPRFFFPRNHPTWVKVNINNIVNPCYPASIISLFSGQNGMGFARDPVTKEYLGGRSVDNKNSVQAGLDFTKFWDASGLYCGAGKPFGALADDTPIGDLVHHKGPMLSVQMPSGISSDRTAAGAGTKAIRTPFNFNGYASLIADMAAAGITVTHLNHDPSDVFFPLSPSLTLKSTASGGANQAHDVLDFGSNFLTAQVGPVQTLTPFHATTNGITFHYSTRYNDSLVIGSISATVDNGSGGYISPGLTSPPSSGNPPNFWLDYLTATLADLKNEANMLEPPDASNGPGLTSLSIIPKFTGFGFFIVFQVSMPKGKNKLYGITGANDDPNTFPNPASYLGNVQLDATGTRYVAQVVAQLPGSYPSLAFFAGAAGFFDENATYDFLSFNTPRASPMLEFFRNVPDQAGWFQPNWIYTLEGSAPLQDDQVQTITGTQDMTGSLIWRPHTDQSNIHLTWAYCGKTSVRLINGNQFPVPTLTFSFTSETDGPNPPGNTQWPQLRNQVFNAFSSFEDVPGSHVVYEQMPIMIEHFNNIASIVNAVFKADYIFSGDPRG